MATELMPKLKIDQENNGLRLDVVLSRAYPKYSRSFLQKVLRQGGVSRRGAAVPPDYRVHTGDTFEVVDFEQRPPDEQLNFRQTASVIVPQVLFEDDDLLVINKPAGLVVHPAPGHRGDTLIDWLRGHLGERVSGRFPDPYRLGLVHRLDKETSGVLLVVKNVAAQNAVSRQFRDRVVQKQYAAFVEGVPASRQGIINAPVGRSRVRPSRMAVSGTGRPSETAFEVKESLQEVSQVNLFPKTGRTHQIRVHLSAIGHPIVGDRSYGAKSHWAERFGILRPLLHAERLEIHHPSTGKNISFHAPWPADFHHAQKQFRQAFQALSLLVILLAGMGASLKAQDTSAPAKPAAHRSSSSSSSGTSAALRSLKKDVAALKESLDALKEQVSAIQNNLDQASIPSRFRDLEHAIAELNGKAVSNDNAREDAKTQLLEIRQKLKIQQDTLDQLRDQFDRLQRELIQLKAQKEESPSAPENRSR